MRGLELDQPFNRLAHRDALVRRFNAVIDRIAQQMSQRRFELFQYVAIHLGLFAVDFQPHLFAKGAAQVTHHSRLTDQHIGKRAHPAGQGGVVEQLRTLPGLGAYTAAAVAAIAFGRRAVVVDANVERVTTRLFALAEPLPAARPRIRALADTITPDARAGDFAQAMMDLGSSICTTRKPRCLLCPLAAPCRARAEGDPETYPVKPAKKAKPHRRGIAYWLEAEEAVLLVRRPDKGLLGRMRALPGGGWGETPEAAPPVDADWRPIGTVEHVFTHFSLSLDIVAAGLPARPAFDAAGSIWWPVDTIEQAGLPTLYARAAALGRALPREAAPA